MNSKKWGVMKKLTNLALGSNLHLATRWARELLFATLAACISLAIGLVRTQAWHVDLARPLQYTGDVIQAANLVAAAQAGTPFYFDALGWPGGQYLNSTAYGAEWMQASLAALFGSSDNGPWLASNIYLFVSIFLISFCAYFASRLLGISVLPSLIVATTMGVLRSPFAWAGWPILQNYSALLLITAIVIRLAAAAKFEDLVTWLPDGSDARLKRSSGIGLVIVALGLTASVANYYMWFAVLLIATLVIIKLFRRDTWPTAKRLAIVGAGQLAIIAIALAPIVFTRFMSGKSIQETSTGDRRAFAALVNGGDFPSLFISEPNTFSRLIAEKIPPLAAFLSEYQGSFYIVDPSYRGGLAVLFASLAGLLAIMGAFNRTDAFTRMSNMTPTLKATYLVFGIFVLMYLRGTLGLAFAFVLPFLRAFDRAIPLVTFLALVILGLYASRLRGKALRSAFTLALCISLLDYASGISAYNQEDPSNGSVSQKDKLDPALDYVSADYKSVVEMVQTVESQVAPGCSVLVLPVTTYPVDFESGLTSYLTYDTVKPALVPSGLKWSSGIIPDTLGSSKSSEYRDMFLKKEYLELAKVAKSDGACATVIFGSLQNALAKSRPDLFDSEDKLGSTVTRVFGNRCSFEPQALLTTYCG